MQYLSSQMVTVRAGNGARMETSKSQQTKKAARKCLKESKREGTKGRTKYLVNKSSQSLEGKR